MFAGQTYVIDLQSKQFDAYLRLEDGRHQLLGADDDGAGDHDARLVFTAPKDGTYRVIATSFQQQGMGTYTLVIREFVGSTEK
jgi:hypothetical protein